MIVNSYQPDVFPTPNLLSPATSRFLQNPHITQIKVIKVTEKEIVLLLMNLLTLLKWMKQSRAFTKKGIPWDNKPP